MWAQLPWMPALLSAGFCMPPPGELSFSRVPARHTCEQLAVSVHAGADLGARGLGLSQHNP